MQRSLKERVRGALEWMRRRAKGKKDPELPPDPYAYVSAPKKPRPSARSAAAVAEPPEDY